MAFSGRSKLILTTKAAMLILVVMAVATTPGTCTYSEMDQEGGVEVYSPQDVQAGGFPVVEPGGAAAAGTYTAGHNNGRKLVQTFNLCGRGTFPVYNCRNKLGTGARTPMCCSGGSNLSRSYCVDLSRSELHCGNCRTRCTATRRCCGGVCVRIFNDRNNCGRCGTSCGTDRRGRPQRCQFGLCGY